MLRSILRIGERLLLVAALGFVPDRLAWAADGRGDTRYPDYDVRYFCRSDASARPGERKHDCEDREHAVSILLRRHWAELVRSEPTLIAACADRIGHFEVYPSYVSLLQCLTRVRDAAD